MWIGKIAIIMYVFSIAILFSAYYLNQVFDNPALGANGNITFAALNTLMNSYALNQQINIDLVFGDFIAALTVLFGIVTGSTLTTAFTLIPFVDTSILLLQGILFDFASVLLWIYIVSGRSL